MIVRESSFNVLLALVCLSHDVSQRATVTTQHQGHILQHTTLSSSGHSRGMSDWIDIVASSARAFCTLCVFVAAFWRLGLLQTDYLGWMIPSRYIRVWVVVVHILMIYALSPPAVAGWLVTICLDLVITHRVSDQLWIYNVCSIGTILFCWVAWISNPSCFGIAWALNAAVVLLATLALWVAWPLGKAKEIYTQHAPRPKSSKVFCALYVLFACLSFVSTCFVSFRLVQLIVSLGAIVAYEWFYTWQFAYVSVMRLVSSAE